METQWTRMTADEAAEIIEFPTGKKFADGRSSRLLPFSTAEMYCRAVPASI